MAAAASKPRHKLIATLFVAKRQLSLDEEMFRDVLEEASGERSIRSMDLEGLEKCLWHLKSKGFRPTFGAGRFDTSTLSEPARRHLAKLRALWISGYHLGVVKNRDDDALLKFISRQTGLDHPRFLINGQDAGKAIEGLKGWLQNARGVVWEGDPRQAVFQAQMATLTRLGAGAPGELLERFAGVSNLELLSDAQWDEAIKKAGRLLRARLKAEQHGAC